MDIFRRFLLRPLFAVLAGVGGVARLFHLFLCKAFHSSMMEISRGFSFWPLFSLSGVLPPPLPMCFILLLICCQRSTLEVNTPPLCKLFHTLRTNKKRNKFKTSVQVLAMARCLREQPHPTPALITWASKMADQLREGAVCPLSRRATRRRGNKMCPAPAKITTKVG